MNLSLSRISKKENRSTENQQIKVAVKSKLLTNYIFSSTDTDNPN